MKMVKWWTRSQPKSPSKRNACIPSVTSFIYHIEINLVRLSVVWCAHIFQAKHFLVRSWISFQNLNITEIADRWRTQCFMCLTRLCTNWSKLVEWKCFTSIDLNWNTLWSSDVHLSVSRAPFSSRANENYASHNVVTLFSSHEFPVLLAPLPPPWWNGENWPNN